MIQQLSTTQSRIPPGEYTLTEPLVVTSSLNCEGCRFKVAHDGPGIVLNRRWASIRGGRFDFPANSIGPMVQITNSVQCRVEGVNLRGGSSRLAVGIEVDGTQPTYFAAIVDVQIADAKIGIRLGEHANGAQVRNPFLERLGLVAFDFDHALENRIDGGFVHGGGGSGGITVIRMRNGSIYNHVTATAEPGNGAIPYDLGPGCNDNQILGQLNCGGRPVDQGTGNWIVRLGDKRNF